MSLLTSAVSLLGHALPATRANRLLILIYHRVHADPDPMLPGEVDAERFDSQMGLLRRYCHPMPLADGVAGLRAGKLPPRAVAVTFDDGYADNVTVALPILQRHSIKATFFIATGFLDGGRMWNDTVIEAVRRAAGGELDLRVLDLKVEPLGDPAARGALAEKILRKVKHLHPTARLAKVEALKVQVGASLPGDLMMTSAQLCRLSDAGMLIGAHTINHPILCTLSDEEALAEIRDSRSRLEQITAQSVMVFAYPNGRPDVDYTRRDRDLVESLGFDCAVSTASGAATTRSDLFQLPRFGAWDREPERWLARLLLAFGRVS